MNVYSATAVRKVPPHLSTEPVMVTSSLRERVWPTLLRVGNAALAPLLSRVSDAMEGASPSSAGQTVPSIIELTDSELTTDASLSKRCVRRDRHFSRCAVGSSVADAPARQPMIRGAMPWHRLATLLRIVFASFLVLTLSLTYLYFSPSHEVQWKGPTTPALAVVSSVVGDASNTYSVSAPWAVLVQHEDAMTRLSLTERSGCDNLELDCETHRVSPSLLPSWTLHLVEPSCVDCTDTATYATAIAATRDLVPQRHGVFATPAAPLGRVGPILFAMLSVTDEISAPDEMPRWLWLNHTYRCVPAVSGELQQVSGANHHTGCPARHPPYLAVMGIPSTDNVMRLQLREAQRRTWLTYLEVARNENGFQGALLQLYLFAASERATTPNVSTAARDTATAAAQAYANASSVAPTVKEYELASKAQESIAGGGAGVTYRQRRMALRSGWTSSKQSDESPCSHIQSVISDGTAERSALSYLSGALSLPVTPAFVAGSRFICHASSALWQEALTHRNVLWIDMMTDRRPTTKKKLGEAKNWGLPVEVGMSQKLILWLAYAYHAFKDVPFIIKGDDDAYVKVPQFLSDVRFITDGEGIRQLPPSPMTTSPLSAAPVLPTPEGSATSALGAASLSSVLPPSSSSIAANSTHAELAGRIATYLLLGAGTRAEAKGSQSGLLHTSASKPPRCVYWGSTRHVSQTRFNAGMLFMAHRQVVQAVLELPESPSIAHLDGIKHREFDVIRMTLRDFDARFAKEYYAAHFTTEDILFGFLIRHRQPRVQQLCPDKKLYYVKESLHRFHDLRVGRAQPVSWSTVVAHRTRPADLHYLHYFFRTEHTADAMHAINASAAMLQRAATWAQAQKSLHPSNVTDWNDLPDTKWATPPSSKPPLVVAPGDGVGVYSYEYMTYRAPKAEVYQGFQSRP
ncbi:phosphoglycan beta 1,3 galactosyltransferase [Leishmania panamensis]|uniref:Phosphoglycan beta 1,3 galactosyltransferase n=1 Tax=Leishmania panamensis TaxID=5679 RepID=A0A088RJ94_LEIPA|nr:phosphoglycan beta 1,3 galactosyltransferase [Leishmania panamensis]AIN95194.1 phosphoglycan beta 1,3 galactosyltransferase [Leishmania panamensis]